METRTSHANQLTDLMRAELPLKLRSQLLEGLEGVLQNLDEQIRALEKAADELLEQEPVLRADFNVLKTVPGIGPVVAGGLMGELGDLRRFDARRILETFTGMNVVVRESGKRLNQTKGLAKEGSQRVRRLLFLAAMAAVRGKNSLQAFYKRLVERGKKKKVALGAVMRKLLGIIRRVIITGEEYDDNKVCYAGAPKKQSARA